MTTQETYKKALKDILNSKTTDVKVLRKIALKAFTKPIKDIADTTLNWFQFSDSDTEWFLKVNEVQVACLANEGLHEPDGGKWVLFDYDTDFADIFKGGAMPDFTSLEEGKKYVEMRFLLWLKCTSEQLLKTPNPCH